MMSENILTLSTSPPSLSASNSRRIAGPARRRRSLYGRTRQYFTGKGRDAETGLYYYGARYLDHRAARWAGGDPALGEYIPAAGRGSGGLPGMGGVYNTVNLHAYHYARNNPVKYVDPDGRAAGDEFDTMDGAARDFANTYNDDSIRHNREYGSSIYLNKNSKYVYSVPNVGKRRDVKPSRDSNQNSERVATIHTHTDGMDMYVFSDEDIDLAYREKISSYLVTADGSITKYDPAKDVAGSYNSWKFVVEAIPSNAPNLRNYNNYPDNKINPRSIRDLLLVWRPYSPQH
jgi:RHS repeat-associated protein